MPPHSLPSAPRKAPRGRALALGAVAVIAAGALLGGACTKQGQYTADSDWTNKDKQDLDNVGTPEELTTPGSAASLWDFDWVGVRHDLILAPDQPRKARCNCLAVEVGRPYDSKFAWEGAEPRISPDKLALAISSRGIDCPGGDADERVRRPSIRGVVRRGDDVIVEVEEIPPDRPMATGAVFEMPLGDGGIYVKPVSKKLPYATTPDGKQFICRVY